MAKKQNKNLIIGIVIVVALFMFIGGGKKEAGCVSNEPDKREEYLTWVSDFDDYLETRERKSENNVEEFDVLLFQDSSLMIMEMGFWTTEKCDLNFLSQFTNNPYSHPKYQIPYVKTNKVEEDTVAEYAIWCSKDGDYLIGIMPFKSDGSYSTKSANIELENLYFSKMYFCQDSPSENIFTKVYGGLELWIWILIGVGGLFLLRMFK